MDFQSESKVDTDIVFATYSDVVYIWTWVVCSVQPCQRPLQGIHLQGLHHLSIVYIYGNFRVKIMDVNILYDLV